jgi:hypothetical protein
MAWERLHNVENCAYKKDRWRFRGASGHHNSAVKERVMEIPPTVPESAAPAKTVTVFERLCERAREQARRMAPPAPRRQRKRSLTKVCESARKAGADRVIVDGVVIALSPAAAVPEPTANEWDSVLPGGDHGPH